jgi:hypothetical protein
LKIRSGSPIFHESNLGLATFAPAATSATQCFARRRLQRNLIAASRPFRSLPPFDIASAPLTYVAAHTAHLATKVE